MPKGSAIQRLQHVKDLGAEAEITDLNYDDTVELLGFVQQYPFGFRVLGLGFRVEDFAPFWFWGSLITHKA